jgi:hypothetical protein
MAWSLMSAFGLQRGSRKVEDLTTHFLDWIARLYVCGEAAGGKSMRTKPDYYRGLLWFCALGCWALRRRRLITAKFLRAVFDLVGSAVMLIGAVARPNPCHQGFLNSTR